MWECSQEQHGTAPLPGEREGAPCTCATVRFSETWRPREMESMPSSFSSSPTTCSAPGTASQTTQAAHRHCLLAAHCRTRPAARIRRPCVKQRHTEVHPVTGNFTGDTVGVPGGGGAGAACAPPRWIAGWRRARCPGRGRRPPAAAGPPASPSGGPPAPPSPPPLCTRAPFTTNAQNGGPGRCK